MIDMLSGRNGARKGLIFRVKSVHFIRLRGKRLEKPNKIPILAALKFGAMYKSLNLYNIFT